jgi:hypothetical protein
MHDNKKCCSLVAIWWLVIQISLLNFANQSQTPIFNDFFQNILKKFTFVWVAIFNLFLQLGKILHEKNIDTRFYSNGSWIWWLVIVWFEINNLMHYVQVVSPSTKYNVMTWPNHFIRFIIQKSWIMFVNPSHECN